MATTSWYVSSVAVTTNQFVSGNYLQERRQWLATNSTVGTTTIFSIGSGNHLENIKSYELSQFAEKIFSDLRFRPGQWMQFPYRNVLNEWDSPNKSAKTWKKLISNYVKRRRKCKNERQKCVTFKKTDGWMHAIRLVQRKCAITNRRAMIGREKWDDEFDWTVRRKWRLRVGNARTWPKKSSGSGNASHDVTAKSSHDAIRTKNVARGQDKRHFKSMPKLHQQLIRITSTISGYYVITNDYSVIMANKLHLKYYTFTHDWLIFITCTSSIYQL